MKRLRVDDRNKVLGRIEHRGGDVVEPAHGHAKPLPAEPPGDRPEHTVDRGRTGEF
jgi:hypothetical protein